MTRRAAAAMMATAGIAFLAVGAVLFNAAPEAGTKPMAGAQQVSPAPTPTVQPNQPSYTIPNETGRLYLGTADHGEAVRRGLVPEGTRSVLQTAEAMRHGQFVWQDDGKAAGDLLVWVDLDRQLVSAFRGGHEIGTSVILYGAEGRDSPLGSFPIKDKRERYHSRAYDAPMPYSLWLTDDGVALHGSDVRWGRATHGCVGVPVEFARRLFDAAEEGDVVRILRSSRLAQGGATQT